MAAQQDGADMWSCSGQCAEDYNRLEQEPILIEEVIPGEIPETLKYEFCVACIEEQLEPIATGQEHTQPAIGHTPLCEIPVVQQRINPELWRRIQEARGFMRNAPAHTRVYCFNPQREDNCNHYLGTRTECRNDRAHQWMQCPQCHQNVCMACRKGQLQAETVAGEGPCELPADIVDREEKRHSAERGKSFQFCPFCDRLIEENGGCNEFQCPCGTRFCWLCDAVAEADHWEAGYGCPRFGTGANDPRAIWDDPWSNPDFLGARDMPVLQPSESPWLDSARRITHLDQEVREHRRMRIGGGENVVKSVRLILLFARQLITLVHNRCCADWEQDVVRVREQPEDILERFVFCQMAMSYIYEMAELARMDGLQHLPNDDPAAAAGPIKWIELYQQVRILTVRNTWLWDRERLLEEWGEWRELRTLISKLLQKYGVNTAAAVEGEEPGDGAARQTSAHTRAIALRLRRVVNWILASGNMRFTASSSFYFQAELRGVQTALDQIGATSLDAFRDAGPDQRFVCDVADHFLFRLFVEKHDNVALFTGVSFDDSVDVEHWPVWNYIRMFVSEMLAVCREARREVVIECMPDMPGRIFALFGNLVKLSDMLESGREPLGMDYAWGTAFRLQSRALLDQESGDPTPGDDVLRPLFLNNARCLNYLLGIFQFHEEALETPPPPRAFNSPEPTSPRSDPGDPGDPGDRRYGSTLVEWRDHLAMIRSLHVDAERGVFHSRDKNSEDQRRLSLQYLLILLENIVDNTWPPEQRAGNAVRRDYLMDIVLTRQIWERDRLFPTAVFARVREIALRVSTATRQVFDDVYHLDPDDDFMGRHRPLRDWQADQEWILDLLAAMDDRGLHSMRGEYGEIVALVRAAECLLEYAVDARQMWRERPEKYDTEGMRDALRAVERLKSAYQSWRLGDNHVEGFWFLDDEDPGLCQARMERMVEHLLNPLPYWFERRIQFIEQMTPERRSETSNEPDGEQVPG